jgi:hypothetical protein
MFHRRRPFVDPGLAAVLGAVLALALIALLLELSASAG